MELKEKFKRDLATLFAQYGVKDLIVYPCVNDTIVYPSIDTNGIVDKSRDYYYKCMNNVGFVSELEGFLRGARYVLSIEEIGSVFEEHRSVSKP
jgi:hypothetical protein